jgi:3-oxoacyl-[acyl-carrier protein] reductase
MKLQNETALITGGSSGIGKKFAEKLLAEGCSVAICSRTKEKVDRAVQEFAETYGDKIVGMVADVSKPEDMVRVVGETVDRFGSIRILIANAGINLKYGPFDHYQPQDAFSDAQKILAVNLLGAINAISAALPYMHKQKYGRIVMMSGGGADRPIGNMTFYSASKGGVGAFARCFAVELDESRQKTGHDIRVNLFQPGMLRTNLTQNVDVVDNWEDLDKVESDTDFALQYMGGDIDESTSHIVPIVMPSSKANGKLIRGFSLFKLIRGAMKMKRAMKHRD